MDVIGIILLVFFPFGGVALTLIGIHLESRNVNDKLINEMIGFGLPISIFLIWPIVSLTIGLTDEISTQFNGEVDGANISFLLVGIIALLSGIHSYLLRR